MNRKVGVLLSYVLMVFEVASTLLLTPYIIRTLGQAEYGVYKLSAAITAYLLLLDLGVGNAVTRFVAKYRFDNNKESCQKFMGIATVYYSAIAVISFLIGIVLVVMFPMWFSKGLSPAEIELGQKLLFLTIINCAITLASTAYTNVIIAYEHYTVSKGLSILQIVLRVVLTFVALNLGMGAVGIVVVNLLLTLCCRAAFVYYVIVILKIKPILSGITFSYIREIMTYSSLILIQMIATQINASVDQILIGSCIASSAVILAVYGVGTQIVQYFQSIGYAFTGVLMPGIVRMVENGANAREITDEMIRIGRIIMIVLSLIWGGFLVNGRNFIILWAGNDNNEAYLVALILMTVYLVILTESVGSQVLWAMNKHKEQAILKLAIVLLNVALTVVLIKWKPIAGATIGTFISLFFGDVVVMNIIFAKKIGIDLMYYYKGLLKGIFPSLTIMVLVGYMLSLLLKTGWIDLVISVFGMSATYGICLLLFGMNDNEKNLCKSIIGKLIKRR